MGNMVYFLIMGNNAGFLSSTVAPFHVDGFQLLTPPTPAPGDAVRCLQTRRRAARRAPAPAAAESEIGV